VRYSTSTRWIATALAVGAMAAPSVQAADYHQPFGDGGGSSPGGPAYGIVRADEVTQVGGGSSSGGPAFGIVTAGVVVTAGGHSSGGPAYGIVPSGLALTGGGQSSGGPAYGIVPSGLALTGGGQSSGGPAFGGPVLQAPADAAAPATTPAGGFDWADAGVGAGIGIAALLLAAAAAGVVRSRGKLAHS